MFNSPTYGKVNLEQLRKIIGSFMTQDKEARYEIIVGTDSQKSAKEEYDFVSALIIHRVGFGAIFFGRERLSKEKSV